MTLYRKYRPVRWADIAGQNHVKVTLAFEVATGKIAHAYLFSGPRGIGKTTVARIFAKSINCQSRKKEKGREGGESCGECPNCRLISDGRTLDIIEIDAASNRGIDNVRENIIENSRFSPSKLQYKVFIIDEVHMMTTEAFNALLKTLEEPPAHAVFILATTELHKVPPTIVSRCQRFDFRKIPFADLTDRLHSICEQEKCKVDSKVLEEIAHHSDGSLRDAEGLLGKVLTIGDGKRVTYDEALVVLPRSDFESVSSFVDSLLRRDSRSALLTVNESLDSGLDLDQFVGDSIELLRKILLTKMSGNPEIFAFDMDEGRKKRLSEWAESAETAMLVRTTELLLEKKRALKYSHPIQLPVELAVIQVCEKVSAAPAETRARSGSRSGDTDSRPVPGKNELPEKNEPAEKKTAKEPAPKVETRTETKEPEEEAIRTDGEPVATLDKLFSVWPDFTEKAGEENHSLRLILDTAEPVAVHGQKVVVGCAYRFHKDKLCDSRNIRIIERILGDILEARVAVEGVVLEKESKTGHNGTASEEKAGAKARSGDDLASAFGGRVVE